MAVRQSKVVRALLFALMCVVLCSFGSEILISFGLFSIHVERGEMFAVGLPVAVFLFAAVLVAKGEFAYGRPGHVLIAIKRTERPIAFWSVVLAITLFATLIGLLELNELVMAHGG